jgi:predicted AAA+ superfamily ATPase
VVPQKKLPIILKIRLIGFFNWALNEQRLLEQRLIYGYYPDVVNNPGDERAILRQLSESCLFKDILTWEKIKKPDRSILLA